MKFRERKRLRMERQRQWEKFKEERREAKKHPPKDVAKSERLEEADRPERYIAVIADKGAEEGLKRFVKSLRVRGWEDTIYVYSPMDSIPDIPEGCEISRRKPWWRGGRLEKAQNTAAFLKPTIFMDRKRFPDGSQVLYMDCNDIVVFCDPHKVFDIAFGNVLTAREFGNKSFFHPLNETVKNELNLDDSILNGYVRINSGVIIGTMGKELRCAMKLWDKMLRYIPKIGTQMNNDFKIGDQKFFNYVFRVVEKEGNAGYIPDVMNYRGGGNVRILKIRNGLPVDDKNRIVWVPHCTGKNNNIPEKILSVALGEKE